MCHQDWGFFVQNSACERLFCVHILIWIILSALFVFGLECLTPSFSLLNNYNDHNVCLVRKSMVMHQRFTVIRFTTVTYTTVEEVFKLHG